MGNHQAARQEHDGAVGQECADQTDRKDDQRTFKLCHISDIRIKAYHGTERKQEAHHRLYSITVAVVKSFQMFFP